jgi:hypothetical protein
MNKTIDLKFAILQIGYVGGQSKGCWAAFQFGYCRLLCRNLWPRDRNKGAWIDVFLFGPSHNPAIGYRRRHIGVWLSLPFRRRSLRFDLMAGSGYGLPKWRSWFPAF